MKRYKIQSLIGDGTYGLVYLAVHAETREKVAVKTMKRRYNSWDEVMDLREVREVSYQKLFALFALFILNLRIKQRIFFCFQI